MLVSHALPMSGREQHLPAGGRQVRQRDRRLWLRRLLWRFRVEDGVAEPPIEILAASFSIARRLLSFALGASWLAHDAHVEMIIVPPPGAHLVQEGAIISGLAAQRLLDRRIDEDALDLGIL